jgi:hypothetical protein
LPPIWSASSPSALVHRGIDRDGQPVGADAIGDEARRVRAGTMRLPSFRSTKSARRHGRIGVGAGHDFHEPHVTRRIEEMGDQEVC